MKGVEGMNVSKGIWVRKGHEVWLRNIIHELGFGF
jgi:hypothetical protein